MKSEQEIKEMKERLESTEGSDLNQKGFIETTSKSGHWSDCLDWVLNKGE